jgi:hypothetical protein
VIGVSTVMTMATIVKGIRDPDPDDDQHRRPDDVLRDEDLLVHADQPRPAAEVQSRAARTARRGATRIASLAEVAYAGIWSQIQARISYNGVRTRDVIVYGADDRYQETFGGELVAGRWFTKSELRSGAPVVGAAGAARAPGVRA